MSYPGNPALAADVQARIQEAYRHSVESAAAGKADEARQGCEFVLRLDPQFGPAKALARMLEEERPAESYRELLGPAEEKPAPRTFAAAAPGLVSTFSRLLEARKFEEILSAAQAQSAAVSGDPKLADLVALAQSRFEAEPMVRQFLDGARQAIGAGKLDQVSDLLDKARELDATHPGLAEIERLRASASSLQNSLTIDWDEDDSLAVPPPEPAEEGAEAPEGDAALFEPEPPPALAAPPDADTAAATEAEPAQAEGAAVAFGVTPDGLDLPDIDFSIAAEEPGAVPPGLLAEGSDLASPFDAEPASGEETDGRVQTLLDEGEDAFGRGEYQGAIDAWSRIFLIDIDNAEAAQRIEKARQLKAEQEREVEEIFHGGVARFDAGEWEEAREAFRQVLELQPSYVLAREYLDKINEREAGEGAPTMDLPEIAPANFDAEPPPARGLGRGVDAILVPPEPGSAVGGATAPAIDGFAVRARRGNLPSPTFLAIGGAVLVLLIVGGWFLLGNWSRLFPNSRATAPAAPTPNPVAQAKKLQSEGKTAIAIAQLRRIPPQDSKYAEAQSLISQWEKLSEAAAGPALAPEQAAARQMLLERADSARAGGENYLAGRLYGQAAEIAPLAGDEVRRAAEAEQHMTAYREELSLMKDGEYEMALNRLWRRHDAQPDDADTVRLMVDSYYNLALSDLQRGAPGDANRKVKEALSLDRSDPMLERLERFTSAYSRRDQDLLYRIFVKYLTPR